MTSHDAPTTDPISLQEIGQIHMRARDLKRAVTFYRAMLRMPFLFEVPNMAFFQCGPVILMLGIPEGPEFDHPGSILYFKVADIERAHRDLAARGVRFVSEPHVIHRQGERHLWMAFFHDSEENMLALMCWRDEV